MSPGSPTSCTLTSFEFVPPGGSTIQSTDFTDCYMQSVTSISSGGLLRVSTTERVGLRRIFFTINYAGGISVSGSVEIEVIAVGGGGGGSSYSNSSPTYANGSAMGWDAAASSWSNDPSFMNFLRFSGASGPLSATTITSAVLTLSGITPDSDGTIRLRAESSWSATLPADNEDAQSRTFIGSINVSMANASIDVDVSGILASIRALSLSGSIITFALLESSWNEGAYSGGATASLAIAYS